MKARKWGGTVTPEVPSKRPRGWGMRGSAASLGLGPCWRVGAHGKGAPGEGVHKGARRRGAHPTWGSGLQALCGHCPCRGPRGLAGGRVGWGPCPSIPPLSAVSQRPKLCLRSWGDSGLQPWGGLVGPRRGKPAADGETVARWVSAPSWRPWAAGPHLELLGGGVWDASLGAWGLPAAAITHRHRPGTEQNPRQSPGPFPAPAPAPSVLPASACCNLTSPRLSFPLAK